MTGHRWGSFDAGSAHAEVSHDVEEEEDVDRKLEWRERVGELGRPSSGEEGGLEGGWAAGGLER